MQSEWLLSRAELLGVDLASLREAAAKVEPYPRRRHQDLEPHAA
jgi:hypothetical protein